MYIMTTHTHTHTHTDTHTQTQTQTETYIFPILYPLPHTDEHKVIYLS